MVTETRPSRAEKAANIDFLRLTPLFAGLDDSVLTEISRMMSFRTAMKNEILWLEQEPADVIYFVASGLVKLFKTSPGGKEQILKLVQPGDYFGHGGVLNGGTHAESAQVVAPSELYGISSNEYKLLLIEYQQLAFNTIKLLASETRHYISLVEDLSLRCVSGRLARMLLNNDFTGSEDTSLSLTRADMAAMTGTVREVIGKSLKALEEKGVISYDRRNIVIRDAGALESLMQSV